MQVEGLARPCHGYLCCYSERWTSQPVKGLDWLAGPRFVGVHSSAIHSLPSTHTTRPQPSAFLCGSNPTSAANMVSGVLITVANRASPSSDLCTLCLQQRRDTCEPRSKGTQGVPVYTECLWTVSVDSLDTWFHSCHACHACHAETACPSPLWVWPHARSHHRAPFIATPSCQTLPPQTSLLFAC